MQKDIAKILPATIIILLSLQVSAIDSLLTVRSELKEQYTQLISSPRSSPQTEREIFDLQNRIIAIDDHLLSDHLMVAIEEKNQAQTNLRIAQSDAQSAQLIAMEAEEQQRGLMQMGKLLLLFFAFLLLAALIIITMLLIKNKNYKRTLGTSKIDAESINSYKEKIAALQKEVEKLKTPGQPSSDIDIEKFKSQLSESETKAGKMHIQIIQLKNEKKQLEEKLEQNNQEPQIGEVSVASGNDRLSKQIRELEVHNRDIRKELEETSASNKTLGEELQKVMEANTLLTAELNESKSVLPANDEDDNLRKQLILIQAEEDKLKQKIEIYREQLDAEKRVREKFEKEIWDIINDYKNILKEMRENE